MHEMRPSEVQNPIAIEQGFFPPDVAERGFSDARLVDRARQGDDDAFGILVQRYELRLVHILNRLTLDHELARDLAQETFWKVYKRLDRFDTARRFGPWLFRVGVNLALDYLRRNRLAPAPLVGNSESSNGRSLAIPDPRAQTELAQEVLHVLQKIPADYRAVLVLRDVEGFSSAEVAAIVGRRDATVRWRLSKAREMFREIWERRQNGVPPQRQEAQT